MTSDQIQYLIDNMTAKGVEFESGLSIDEIMLVEQKFDFAFPPDLKSFLCTALPVSKGSVNWRKGLTDEETAANIVWRLAGPLDGILFDVENNDFWYEDWGKKPDIFLESKAIVELEYQNYPKLIPVFYHRFISEEPHEVNNPIISVHQTDIIYYGYNLANYLMNEFHFNLRDDFYVPDEPKTIRFWNDMMN